MLATMLASFVDTFLKEHMKENLAKDPLVETILKLVHEGKICQF